MLLKILKTRLYFLPGWLLSALVSLSPSFRLSSFILYMAGCKVDLTVTIHNRVRLLIPGRLTVLAGTTINSSCFLDNRFGIEIGSNSMIGRCSNLYTMGHHNDSDLFSTWGAPIKIGSNVVIYPHCLIMPGVQIGDRAVIYPGSVVTTNVGANQIVAGNPARFVKDRDIAVDYTLSYKTYFGV